MFGLFKKTKWKLEGNAFNFFKKVFSHLPSEFKFLEIGLDNGLYISFFSNKSIHVNYYNVGYDSNLTDKSMTEGIQFELKNIIISQDGLDYNLNMTIFDGILVGFEIEKNIIDFNNFQIDLKLLKKTRSKFEPEKNISELTNGLYCEKLNLSNLSELEIEGKSYYQIKDLGDGNVIAIDSEGQVFGLIHDPYKIELINPSIKHFVDDINSNLFDIEKYLDGENGNA
jgi:hypothetical protein